MNFEMKSVIILFFSIFMLLQIFCIPSGAGGSSSKLRIEFTGLDKASSGIVRSALFDKASTFSDQRYHIEGALKTGSLPIENQGAIWEIEDLPHGVYAVRAFHDQDESGRFKVNRFGIPKYAYGFSNNARAVFGPPSFERCKFRLDRDLTLKIQLHR